MPPCHVSARAGCFSPLPLLMKAVRKGLTVEIVADCRADFVKVSFLCLDESESVGW
jgi:hypothetical protein